MSNKNPFEIRLEVLKMAQEMLMQTYQDAQAIAWSMVEKTAEYQNKTIADMADMQEYYENIKPHMFTPDEVIDKANKLYEFIVSKEPTKSKQGE